MPAHDKIHHYVKSALVKDGWIITHDPFVITLGAERLFADLGAERPIAAERGSERIVVEIKSFLGDSLIHDLEEAIGQYWLYHNVLAETEPDRKLYLAIRDVVFDRLQHRAVFRALTSRQPCSLVIVNIEQEVIVEWKP